MKEIIIATAEFVKRFFSETFDGNDYMHTERVYSIALQLTKETNASLPKEKQANNFLVALGALLHSIDKAKDRINGVCPQTREFLATQHLDSKIIDSVCAIIATVDFAANRKHLKLKSLECEIVADANMLDAIGAIGIARCFAYGGFHKLQMYDGAITNANMIKSFYDRLLVIKDCLHTEAAKKIAKDRHDFMESFLQEFYYEWNYGRIKQ